MSVKRRGPASQRVATLLRACARRFLAGDNAGLVIMLQQALEAAYALQADAAVRVAEERAARDAAARTPRHRQTPPPATINEVVRRA